MREQKKLSFTRNFKKLGTKFKWFLFTELQDIKITSNYIDFICPAPKKTNSDPVNRLENIVRESLIKEFSPEIQKSKSFNLLVDAVLYNIQKKSIEKDN